MSEHGPTDPNSSTTEHDSRRILPDGGDDPTAAEASATEEDAEDESDDGHLCDPSSPVPCRHRH